MSIIHFCIQVKLLIEYFVQPNDKNVAVDYSKTSNFKHESIVQFARSQVQLSSIRLSDQ